MFFISDPGSILAATKRPNDGTMERQNYGPTKQPKYAEDRENPQEFEATVSLHTTFILSINIDLW